MQGSGVLGAFGQQQRVRQATKGDEIRARIEANRLKRLAIAEAMKAEAGVTRHDLNREGEGGLAYIGTGVILSPEGRNLRQLYTVAHECGHIFLHNDGEGYWYAGHMKELEAESYAHQAFRHHGMRMPADLSKWGRQYVGSWIEKDRAAGLGIDPRAEAYAAGIRSPYEPLRKLPDEWAARASLAARLRVARRRIAARFLTPFAPALAWLGAVCRQLALPRERRTPPAGQFGAPNDEQAWSDLSDHVGWAWGGFSVVIMLWINLQIVTAMLGYSPVAAFQPGLPIDLANIWTGVAVGLVGACAGAVLRTIVQPWPRKKKDTGFASR